MADTILQSWEYLETLPGTDFFRLYRSPSSALAIFRKRLSSLGKLLKGMVSIKLNCGSEDIRHGAIVHGEDDCGLGS